MRVPSKLHGVRPTYHSAPMDRLLALASPSARHPPSPLHAPEEFFVLSADFHPPRHPGFIDIFVICCNTRALNPSLNCVAMSINEWHARCAASFDKLLSTFKGSDEAPALKDHIPEAGILEARDRYRVWAGNLGAHLVPASRLSLDYRLREASLYHKTVTETLSYLDDSVQIGKKTEDSTVISSVVFRP